MPELKKGTYKVEVTYVLLKHDGPYFKLMLPNSMIVNPEALRSTVPKNFLRISPANIIWDGRLLYPDIFEAGSV